MTKRNRLKKEAHDIAAELWEWDDKKARNRMYKWLHNNRLQFNGYWHIRDMNENELRHLINMLRAKLNEKISNSRPIKLKKIKHISQ